MPDHGLCDNHSHSHQMIAGLMALPVSAAELPRLMDACGLNAGQMRANHPARYLAMLAECCVCKHKDICRLRLDRACDPESVMTICPNALIMQALAKLSQD